MIKNQLVNLGIAKRIHSFVQNTNEIYETVMEVAASSVMKEKAMTKTVGYLSEINSEYTMVRGMQK